MSDAVADVAFAGAVIHWRGPAPYLFVAVPDAHVAAVRDAARIASYGWGCVPVEAEANGVAFTTSLFPKEGGYLVPLKAAVRRAAALELGDTVQVTMRVRAR